MTFSNLDAESLLNIDCIKIFIKLNVSCASIKLIKLQLVIEKKLIKNYSVKKFNLIFFFFFSERFLIMLYDFFNN